MGTALIDLIEGLLGIRATWLPVPEAEAFASQPDKRRWMLENAGSSDSAIVRGLSLLCVPEKKRPKLIRPT
jgi:hypothetical protein